MNIRNIAVDASILNNIDILDDAAAAGDIVVLFYSDGVNVYNKASVSMGGNAGDVVVVAGVKYQVKITPAEAALLKGGALTYKFTKASNAFGDRKMDLVNSGTIAVSNLGGELELEILNYNNSNNQITVTEDYIALASDDTVFVDSAEEVIITTPNSAQVIGKRLRVKRVGAGDVVIKDHEAATIYTINDEHGNIELEATADSWQYFK